MSEKDRREELPIDVSELVRTEQMLRISNERLKVAFHQTPYVLWEVDIEERSFNIYNVDEEKCQKETEIRDFPDSFIDRRIIHPDSAQDFRIFADRMLGGRPTGRGNFMMKEHVNGTYSWIALSYHMVYDETGKAMKAVGVQEKLPELPGILGNETNRRPLPESVRRHLLFRMKANLTRDSVEENWMKGVDYTAWIWRKTYSQMIADEEEHLSTESGRQDFHERFQRERLLKDYDRGKIWSMKEYQRIDRAGNTTWFMDVLNLVKDARSGDICMYFCCVESQIRHDWEKLSKEEPFREPMTGLYDVKTVKNISTAFLEQEAEDAGECALVLIRVIGGENNKNIKRFMAVMFSMALGIDCVIGQYGPGIILVFIPRAFSRFDVKRRIEDAFAYFRVSMADIPGAKDMRLIAGAVTRRPDHANYEEMLMQAALLTGQGKDMAVDTVLFPVKDNDRVWTGLYLDVDEEEVQADDEELERQMTKAEQSAAFRCVTDMLSAKSPEASLTGALRELGKFYHAARTYILQMSEDKESVDMVFEWTAPGKQSILHVTKKVSLDEMPLIRNCYDKAAPVVMNSTRTITLPGRREEEWHFAAYPLKQNEEIIGFVCVENAKEHMGEMGLLRTIAPYLAGEKKRFRTIANNVLLKGDEALAAFPNLSSYIDVVYAMTSETYHSMGVLAMSIPGYLKINSKYGFEYGKRMMTYIVDMLIYVFGKSNIYRTCDSEFVVFFPNTIQEVFTGRCTRLQTQIQRQYPRTVQIGYVWSEGVFRVRQMVKEAQMIMRGQDVTKPEYEKAALLNAYNPNKKALKKNFVPYFQPKVDMRSGEIVGAEALVRLIGDDGKIIPPGSFIEEMEKDGSIRELDLLMFEMVLQQMCEWKQKNYRCIPVSVNMSRVTMLNTSTFASVLAIQSRYPQISAEQVELEITETAGDVEKEILAGIVDNFGQCGIRFELDDFGSGYSNISIFSNIKFRAVKLDRSLVDDLPDNKVSSMMVENITQICDQSDMQCIAEGVENLQQVEELKRVGCVYGQGYYYAKPLPANEFARRFLEN